MTDGQAILEEATAGLFDASGHYGMGQARHYAGMVPPGLGAAVVYVRWKPTPGQGRDGCALDTSNGGVYFLDGAPQLKALTNFSVWTRFQPLSGSTTGTEVILGRVGAWLICRQEGRLAAGVAVGAGIRDVFAGKGPVLQVGKWHDVGLSLAGDMSGGSKIRMYLNGAVIKEATEGQIRVIDAPFQIGGRGLEASFPDSKALYDRVVFYDGVLESRDFVRLSRSGGPPLSVRPMVVEPLQPTFWWNADSEMGHAAGYKPLRWNPKLEAYCVGGEGSLAPGSGGSFYQRNQRRLFEPVLAPEQGYFGAGSATPIGSRRYAVASWFIPEGYYDRRRKISGAVYLRSAKGEPAVGARLELRVYVNDDLELEQTIAAQKEAAIFAAEAGKLASGDKVYVVFRPAALGDHGELWFDYKLELQPYGGAPLPAACPVAEAFRVDTSKPLEEDNGWTAHHYQLCAQARTNRIDLLFVGDSITAGWGSTGKAVWEKQLMRYHPGNFGISGQGTQDVLWRLSHGELEGTHPKAVVLILGSNDINWPAADIVAGVKEVVRQLRARFPTSHLLLGGILPRGEQPNTPERLKILEANAQLAKLDDGRHTHYFNFGDKLLLPDGRLPKEIAPDFLHPSERGYEFWVEAIQPVLDQLFPELVHPKG